MAEELWPLGSTMMVYHNPKNPKKAYAERAPLGPDAASIIFIAAGAFVLIIAIVLFLVMPK